MRWRARLVQQWDVDGTGQVVLWVMCLRARNLSLLPCECLSGPGASDDGGEGRGGDRAGDDGGAKRRERILGVPGVVVAGERTDGGNWARET
jgi:hypothetical protein